MCDELPEGICEGCGNFCQATVVDMGIGPYEFWGERGVHHDYHDLSPCCHRSLVEGGEKLIRQSTHVARKDHKDGKIKKGDKYKLLVFRTWRKDGPHWVHVTKKKI